MKRTANGAMRRVLATAAIMLAGACMNVPPETEAGPVAAPAAAALPVIAPACQAAEHRQFDFWIGHWEVMVAGGKKAGDNKIEMINNGCALMESYSTATGYRGRSFNTYDAARGVWHQTWVDNGGLLLTIEGGLVDGRMVLTGTRTRTTPQGEVLDRISWTPSDDGSVRQVWEVSADQGTTWNAIFDGRYLRKNQAP